MFGNGGTPRATASRFASLVFSRVIRTWYSHHAVQRGVQPRGGGVVADLADVERDDLAARVSTRLRIFSLYLERADETVEVGHDDDVRRAALDTFDGGRSPGRLAIGDFPETSNSS